HWLRTCIEPLVALAEVACCPQEDRLAAAAARLRELPVLLREQTHHLENPSHSLVLATVRHLTDADEYLATYAKSFDKASAASVWVPKLPHDEGLAVVRMPRFYGESGSPAAYLDVGAAPMSHPGIVHIAPQTPESDSFTADFEALVRHHILAHETYPGHRME